MTGTIVLALVLHFIADFLLQSREMGKNKSSKFGVLVRHICIQFGVMALGLMLVLDSSTAIAVSALNAVIHGAIDWNIWRGYKWLVSKRVYTPTGDAWRSYDQGPPQHSLMSDKGVWQYWEDHWFYATIGLDQLLHAVTIILALKVLL